MLTFISSNKDQLLWTLMIMQPDLITAALVEEAVAIVKRKKTNRVIADQVCSL